MNGQLITMYRPVWKHTHSSLYLILQFISWTCS